MVEKDIRHPEEGSQEPRPQSKASYEPPRVESVRLSPEAAEALT